VERKNFIIVPWNGLKKEEYPRGVCKEASMENLADISEPQVQAKKLIKINFPSVYLVSMEEKQFLPSETE